MSLELPEGRIDFVGQKLVTDILRVGLTLTTVVSFIAGFVAQSLRITFGIYAVAVVILTLIVLPPWPVFNRHPVAWLPSVKEKS